MSARCIRVLVVDDSAFARKVIREVLSADEQIEVIAIAHDGLDAVEKVVELQPDVVTLDLLMPNLDGLGVLLALRNRTSARFVIVSTAHEESDLAIRALQAGAVELVHKPTALATDRLYELSTDLIAKVNVAALAVCPRAQVEPWPDGQRSPRAPAAFSTIPLADLEAVALGTSTGGPQALTRLLGELPADFPVPIAIVLHMPVGYTAALAKRLDALCAIDVVEASEGLALRAGLVIIARAGMHMKIVPDAKGGRVHLDAAPLDTPHRPSVDVLFETAARVYGPRLLSVVLTGMGEDGLRGAHAVRQAGGRIWTEAESSCVVYGMPRAVDEARLSDRSVPLDGMMAAMRLLTNEPRR